MHITNQLSRLFGKFAHKAFPSFLQRIINYTYVKVLGLDMSEFNSSSAYPSLNALFTRELQRNRFIDEDPMHMISPCDGVITQVGTIQNHTVLQIKGMYYSIEELLTYHCKEQISRLENGMYSNFYLSPKDYHRYHAPFDCEVKRLIHIPGKLYPVNRRYLNNETDLFVQNERVIMECFLNGKYCYIVFVGALNVGEIIIDFEPSLQTNRPKEASTEYHYDGVSIKKGECLGYFSMGSTIVLLWEEQLAKLHVESEHSIRYGEMIAKLV